MPWNPFSRKGKKDNYRVVADEQPPRNLLHRSLHTSALRSAAARPRTPSPQGHHHGVVTNINLTAEMVTVTVTSTFRSASNGGQDRTINKPCWIPFDRFDRVNAGNIGHKFLNPLSLNLTDGKTYVVDFYMSDSGRIGNGASIYQEVARPGSSRSVLQGA